MRIKNISRYLSAVAGLTLVAAIGYPGLGRGSVAPVSSAALLIKPNIVLVLTDDESMDAVAKMPYVGTRPDWINLNQAFIENSLCCPSRSAILSGQFDTHNGVGNNSQAKNLNDTQTLPVWLQQAGYQTALIGKYLNGYGEDARGPYIPPGWNDWQVPYTPNLYGQYNYPLYSNGTIENHGTLPADYEPNVLAGKAEAFIAANAAKPFFMYFAPTATHSPWRASPSRQGMFKTTPVTHTPDFNEADVSDKPAWISSRPLLTASDIALQDNNRRKEWAGAVSIDDTVKRIDAALTTAGVFNNTVEIFMTDNGYTFGEHRWRTKRCEYEECGRTPMLIRYPGLAAKVDNHLVTNVDMASTITEIAGATPAIPQDGKSFLPFVLGTSTTPIRNSLLLHWPGGNSNGVPGKTDSIPQFWGVRTPNWKYVEIDTGEVELYNEIVDPYELHNHANDSAYATRLTDMKSQLNALKAQAGAATAARVPWSFTSGALPTIDLD